MNNMVLAHSIWSLVDIISFVESAEQSRLTSPVQIQKLKQWGATRDQETVSTETELVIIVLNISQQWQEFTEMLSDNMTEETNEEEDLAENVHKNNNRAGMTHGGVRPEWGGWR